MLRIIIGALIGAAIGGAIGYAGKCSGGGCPLTCNPIGGVLAGALVGALLASSFSSAPRFAPSPNVRHVTNEGDFAAALRATPVALVDFNADWCGPCRRLAPTIHKLADEYAGRVTVISVNVDQARELAAKHAVSGIPDVRVFAAGTQVAQLVGLRSREDYVAALEPRLP